MYVQELSLVIYSLDMISILRISIVFLLPISMALGATQKQSYVIDADSVEYQNNTVVAKGHVEIFKDNYLLKADKFIYNKTAGRASVQGNIFLLTPTGDELYARSLEINTKSKELDAEVVSARLGKEDKFIASSSHHNYPDDSEFSSVYYSPCPVCKDSKPQWQIYSSKIYHTRKEDMSMWNNFFELYGLPVFYLPYIRTAAPDADPKSGFLLPRKFSYRNIYGYGVVIPYYLRISDSADLTYEPMFTTKRGILHTITFNKLSNHGEYTLEADYTYFKNDPTYNVPKHRWYVKTESEHRFNDKWKLKKKMERTSDKAFMEQYKTGSNYLSSKMSIEYAKHIDYGYMKYQLFQGLLSQNQQNSLPIILPEARYHKDINGSNQNNYSFDLYGSNLYRKQGTASRRLAADFEWNKFYLVGNNEFNIISRLTSAIHNFSRKDEANSATRISSNDQSRVYRLQPELELLWKYPLVNITQNAAFYIEPTVNFLLSPNSSINQRVSVNEDSQDLELNDSNIFSNNRYSGMDFIEHGPRVNYGILASIISAGDTQYNFVFGQSYRFNKITDPEYPLNSGLSNKHYSDYVFRAAVKPWSFLEVYYRSRFDLQTKQLRRSEVGANLNFDRIELTTRYITKDFQDQSQFDIRKSLNLAGKVFISGQWYLSAEILRNVTEVESYNLYTKAGVGYSGECSDFNFKLVKDNTTDSSRSLIPGLRIECEVHFKNIN